jgi:transcriptional regulator
MFVPEMYRQRDPHLVSELIRENPLAMLVTSGHGLPHVTHLATLLTVDADDLVGQPIFGHLNRQNPHWAVLSAAAMRSTLVFQGPHGYVSPTVYRISPAAPTWNFTAAHVHGTVHTIEDRAETLRIICSTVRATERRTHWDMTSSLEYFDRLLPGVGAFRMDIDAVDSMFKLSQEQAPDVRERVIRSFAGDASGTHRELAALMRHVTREAAR